MGCSMAGHIVAKHFLTFQHWVGAKWQVSAVRTGWCRTPGGILQQIHDVLASQTAEQLIFPLKIPKCVLQDYCSERICEQRREREDPRAMICDAVFRVPRNSREERHFASI